MINAHVLCYLAANILVCHLIIHECGHECNIFLFTALNLFGLNAIITDTGVSYGTISNHSHNSAVISHVRWASHFEQVLSNDQSSCIPNHVDHVLLYSGRSMGSKIQLYMHRVGLIKD